MEPIRKLVFFCLAACALMASAGVSAQAAQAALTARQVAEKYDDELRHPTMSVKFKLSTCRYKVEQSQMRCVERARERVVENVVKSYGRDMRTIGILSEPASDRGIGMLGLEYWDKRKVNDYWMYLPALNKVKRVISSKESKDSGSYFGSEFYLEDLEEPRLDEYTFKLLPEESVKVLETGKGYVANPAYVLEWTPTGAKRETSNYARMVTWIDKERFVLLKGEYFDQDHVLRKRRNIKNLERIDGRWTPKQVTMDNLADERVTVMDRQALAIGLEVADEYFSQRTLTDEVFRERYLAHFRSSWKQ